MAGDVQSRYTALMTSMPCYLVQMAGSPGAGKSVLAQSIGSALRAAVLDKDVIKSALLRAGLGESEAAGGAYEVLFGLADGLLEQGYSVVLDSPSYYQSIPSNGLALAAKHGAQYVFVECSCSVTTMRRRIGARTPLLSQGGRATRRTSVKPTSGLIVEADTEGPAEEALAKVLAAISHTPDPQTAPPSPQTYG